MTIIGQKEMGNMAAVIDMAEKLRVIKARMKAAQDHMGITNAYTAPWEASTSTSN